MALSSRVAGGTARAKPPHLIRTEGGLRMQCRPANAQLLRDGMQRGLGHLSFLITAVMVCTAGCGGPAMYSVRAQVALAAGKSLAGGRIEFEWQGTDPHKVVNASGIIDADGTFSFSAREGKHRAIMLPPLVPPRGTAGSAPPLVLDPRWSSYSE